MEGLLPIWKERGMTSHDCVFKLRKILKMKKIGHSGTLDPDVDGVLPVAIGKATKVIEYMMDSKKIYTGEITLGFSTTTEDRSGEIVEQKPVKSTIDEKDIDKVLSEFNGIITQTPPMYSAVKINGKRLYEYAREGKVIDRPSREVMIHSFERTSDITRNEEKGTLSFSFHVVCGKGTYVRTLAVDVGRKLSSPSHMSDLTREASSGFDRKDALTLSQIQVLVDEGSIEDYVFPLERALEHMPKYDLSKEEYLLVKNGSRLERQTYMKNQEDEIVFYYSDKAVAIYKVHPTKKDLIKPAKVLRNDWVV
ncbi:tRNA pseudouridine55 synthase [Alkalibacterium subtropicum]|uniref:tRNA pseudouridine synthase B n=1 Tax=Alkalibacterium subtropicum TaxID=753702 RepID=A0A1I1ERI7_9LACT|nr:tRNA pseudouridine(55) synthase TruB [Alkalibacterium subtropicum]SFB89734.1 tRNA pseudouridine55 synthase [Alkalibacterium subtropicum]